MHPNTHHKALLSKSKKVNDWYENLKAKSDLTADYYLRNLGTTVPVINYGVFVIFERL